MVDVTVKAEEISRHVWIRETNEVNPCKHRKALKTSKPESAICSGISMEETYLLAMWCPVYKGRESNLGSNTELGNSSCDAKGKPYKCRPRRGKVPMHMKGADHPVVVRNLL